MLDEVKEFKDLGVIFDTKLKFNLHIDYIVNKAFQMLGCVRRTATQFNNPKTFKILYYSLIRPILLYSSPVWSPFCAVYIRQIESVQHIFLNFMAWKLNLPSPRYSHNYNQIT